MSEPKIGPDGHPIPEVQGVVEGFIQPIVFKDPKQGEAVAVGTALDADGNPLTPEAAAKLVEAGK